MEDLLVNSQVQSMFAELGTFIGQNYETSEKCYSILSHIYEKLLTENKTYRNFRLIIGFSQVVHKDLIPILITAKNDKILGLLIKILAELIKPVECLVPIHQLVKDIIGRSTIIKLNKLLATSKIACVNYKVIHCILQAIKDNKEKLQSNNQGLCSNNFSIMIISDCLCLIKNILHAPGDEYQNHILWMLFSEKFDVIIIDLIADANREQWVILIVEIIALMFKNQHVDQTAKLLSSNTVLNDKTVDSDSSEDNESNTSPHSDSGTNSSGENTPESYANSDDNEIGNGGDQQLNSVVTKNNSNSAPLEKKKFTNTNATNELNVSFLNAGNLNYNPPPNVDEKHKTESVFKQPSSLLVFGDSKRRDDFKEQNKVQAQSEASKDRKKQTSRGHQLSKQSTSDFKSLHNTIVINPIGNKKVKLRMKKNMKKAIKTKLNLQILPKHIPRKEHNISLSLREFTNNFLHNGFNTLVDEIYNLLTSNSRSSQCIDTSLYFWILTYFCRFCETIEIDLNSIRRIVSFKLISFIVHEGLKVSEQLMISKRKKSHDISLQVRHLHLVIMAIKEIIKTVEYYRETAIDSPIYVEFIKDLKNSGNNSPESITWTKDFKSLFVLLVRHYDSNIQAIEYLHDLIVTNHMVLSLFDNVKDCWNLNDSITSHIKKFAAPDIMFNYGLVLHNFKENDELVNEAVFTMMHHIIGVVENTMVLFQPVILKTFLNIFEKKDYQYSRWSDLIEYVINKFLSLPQSKFNAIEDQSGIKKTCCM